MTITRILKVWSGSSIWASLVCYCRFWNSLRVSSRLLRYNTNLSVIENRNDRQGKPGLSLHLLWTLRIRAYVSIKSWPSIEIYDVTWNPRIGVLDVALLKYLVYFQGFCISFLTQLDRSSHNVVETLLQEKLLGQKDARTIVNQPLRKPDMKNEKFLNFEGHWICQGNLEATRSPDYVFTTTVKDNLKCLARIVSGRLVDVWFS